MDHSLYETFARLETAGRKAEAKAAIRAFIASFADMDEKRQWTQDHLNSLPPNRHARIRHELYAEIIFPVLKDRFQAGDPRAAFHLGQTIQNLYSARSLHQQIGSPSDLHLFRMAHSQLPDDADIAGALLDSLLATFGYMDHEWPSGLLTDTGPDALRDLTESIALARRLDGAGRYRNRLDQFEQRVRQAFDRPDGV